MWHLVDECVISPLRNSPEVSPEDSVNKVSSQNDSVRSKSSSKRKRKAKMKAAVANPQAKQLAEQVKQENEVCEKEFCEEMAQRELELKLEYRKWKLKLLQKKRESKKAIISAQNEAELAQLEHEIIGQDVGVKKQDSKVSETVTSLKHCLVPSPNTNTDAESKDKFSKPCTVLNSGMTSGYVSREHKTSEHTSLQYDKQVVVSHADTPVNATAKCLPPKVLEFYAPNSGACTSTAVQTPLIKGSESNMLTYRSTLKPTQPYLFSQGSEYVSQPITTPVGLVSDPQSNTASSCRVHSPQQLTGYSSGYASPVTSVSWSTKLEIEHSEKMSSQTPQVIPSLLRPTCVIASPSVSNSFQACSPGHHKFDSPLNHPCSSSTPLWAPSPSSTSTPQSTQVKSNPLH